ncbi:urate hydroxylase PuuD [Pseudomonas sp. GCM10022188]|uniref:urate hydroxylase PuuD n=1 Tax=Pseudomonas TaxID=286 RepID=UPI001E376647|nr:urate hydroxylase PuuD [Pseudomonas oryzagri]MCC6076761.1 urate hydroxylase PuuD [Pseudomonas oryzagri]
MEGHFTEWLNLSVRWIHMIVGIAWIGASFYFNWLENNLERSNPREGLAGDLWAIHGGGIYHLEKYRLAPPQMPERLHWFKWEAYSTWLSGVALLAVVYYLNPGLYLLAPGSDLAPAAGVAIGLGSLLVGWFVYDLLCDSPLGRRPVLLGAVLFALIAFAAWAYAQAFSGRGAYIHTGALIGTLMVGNVFRVIIPAQRALVKAIAEGSQPDPRLPAKGLLRSRHNNYFTLPVLFIMISNHFPSTYGSSYNWLILAALAALSVLVRHYFNTRRHSQKFAWTLPAAALGLFCLAFVSAPERTAAPPTASAAASGTPSGQFAAVRAVIQARCSPCHSAQPSSTLFSSAPAGVMFDSAEQIRQLAPRIQAQAVASQTMPLGNITQMTVQERALLGAWIANGAPID